MFNLAGMNTGLIDAFVTPDFVIFLYSNNTFILYGYDNTSLVLYYQG